VEWNFEGLVTMLLVLAVSLTFCFAVGCRVCSKSAPVSASQERRDSSGVELAEETRGREVLRSFESFGRWGEPPFCNGAKRRVCVIGISTVIVILAVVLGVTGAFGMTTPAVQWYTCAAPSPEALDEAVERILGVMYRMDLFNSTKCSPPHCEDYLLRNVTSPENVELAAEIAAESIVLLKNDGDILPLTKSTVSKIAVVGSASAAKPANFLKEHLVHQAFWGILTIAIFTILLLVGIVVTARKVKNRVSAMVTSVLVPVVLVLSAYLIFRQCDYIANNWGRGDIYAGGGSGRVMPGYVVTALEGIQRRAAELDIAVISSPSDNSRDGVKVAQEADVTVIVAGTASGEEKDRPTLDLDDEVKKLIGAVAKVSNKVVVILQIPGAVLMPWRSSVQAIGVLFLGGQETGAAWAQVLFGDRAPAGRLPLMMPLTEADTIPPDTDGDVRYTEGLKTSYRNPEFQASFPFGHGLTYSSFTYQKIILIRKKCTDPDCVACLSVSVTNTGQRAAKALGQLYLEFPHDSGYVTPILKGFNKTSVVPPGGKADLIFRLYKKDISYFIAGQWVKLKSSNAFVGESSIDKRQKIKLTFAADGDSADSSEGVGSSHGRGRNHDKDAVLHSGAAASKVEGSQGTIGDSTSGTGHAAISA
jgi:hypothetical protein